MNGSLMNVDFAFTSPNSSSDINDDWTLWRDTLLGIADQYIPRKILKGRKNLPWMTPEIKSLIKKKETIWRKARRTKSVSMLEK